MAPPRHKARRQARQEEVDEQNDGPSPAILYSAIRKDVIQRRKHAKILAARHTEDKDDDDKAEEEEEEVYDEEKVKALEEKLETLSAEKHKHFVQLKRVLNMEEKIKQAKAERLAKEQEAMQNREATQAPVSETAERDKRFMNVAHAHGTTHPSGGPMKPPSGFMPPGGQHGRAPYMAAPGGGRVHGGVSDRQSGPQGGGRFGNYGGGSMQGGYGGYGGGGGGMGGYQRQSNWMQPNQRSGPPMGYNRGPMRPPPPGMGGMQGRSGGMNGMAAPGGRQGAPLNPPPTGQNNHQSRWGNS